ncbi:MAG: holo-ACP synthase [Verrucomicrobiales bacterium]
MTPEFPIGLGVDIVECERIRRIVERGDKAFLNRVFTENERAYCARMAYPAPHYAARFAAKEAVAKALGTGIGASAALAEIEVVRAPNGAPGIQLHGTAAATAARLGLAGFRISLSHTKDLAIAIVQGVEI